MPRTSRPLVMPEYVLQESKRARQAEEEIGIKTQLADQADRIGNRYVLLTVICASVLIFGGVSGEF